MPFNPLDYPLSLGDAQYLTDASAWVGHIPFAWALLEMTRPRTLVELGTLKGDSYCAFCQGIAALKLPARCVAVDTWAGDRHTGGYGSRVLDELRAYHDPKYGSFSTLLRSDFDSAVGQFADGSIDLLHIDGLHTYDAVRHDYQTWLPKVSDRGVILFHDVTVRKRDFGVWQLWDELAPRFPSFLFHHENGLGVLGVGGSLPQPLRDFLAAANERPELVRQYFATIGYRMTLAKLLLVWQSAMSRSRAAVDQWRRETGTPEPPPVAGAAPGIAQAHRLVQDVHDVLAHDAALRGAAGGAVER